MEQLQTRKDGVRSIEAGDVYGASAVISSAMTLSSSTPTSQEKSIPVGATAGPRLN